ncbi:MAG: pyrroloquinoline quinone biosynthesis protein PqqB [Pseudomonadota bacterium]
MSLRVLVVGSAAGGGLPQWNCNGDNSSLFWRGRHPPIAATQSSLAVSSDGHDWILLNASPDIRQQIIARPQLQPRDPATHGLRDTPIRAVLLTNGDIDHIAGLLTLREKQGFELVATAGILDVLAANPIFDALDPALVGRRTVALDQPFDLIGEIAVELFAVPGKVPLYLEGESVDTEMIGEQTVGVEISRDGSKIFYIPGCAAMTPALAKRLEGAELVLFDGTLWRDDEMIVQGLGQKTGKRMGHISMSGEDGSIAAFKGLDVRRKVFIHINNTNPVWRDGPERAEAEAAGWEIAYDGMEIPL